LTLTLIAERQSARMSKITNDGLTQSCTGFFIAVRIWQQWACVKGLMLSLEAEKSSTPWLHSDTVADSETV